MITFSIFIKTQPLKKKIKVISFGINKIANIRLINLKKKKNKYKISININGKNKVFYASCNFENFIKNLLASIAVNSIFRDPLNIDKNIKILLAGGADDPCIVNGKGIDGLKSYLSKKFNSVGIKIFKDMRHEIHNEQSKNELLALIGAFINNE